MKVLVELFGREIPGESRYHDADGDDMRQWRTATVMYRAMVVWWSNGGVMKQWQSLITVLVLRMTMKMKMVVVVTRTRMMVYSLLRLACDLNKGWIKVVHFMFVRGR
jgi:hypothetical protein